MSEVQKWKRRSRENLRAAEILSSQEILDEASVQAVSTFWNPASARLYYSLFQAVVAKLVDKKLSPSSIDCPDPDRWQHDSVKSACRRFLEDRELRTAYEFAMQLRERADYMPESPVLEAEFREIEELVRQKLRALGVAS
jgi:uncharacterized protein (UPF0332 family)